MLYFFSNPQSSPDRYNVWKSSSFPLTHNKSLIFFTFFFPLSFPRNLKLWVSMQHSKQLLSFIFEWMLSISKVDLNTCCAVSLYSLWEKHREVHFPFLFLLLSPCPPCNLCSSSSLEFSKLFLRISFRWAICMKQFLNYCLVSVSFFCSDRWMIPWLSIGF